MYPTADPNILRLTDPSTTFDPRKPIKDWYDIRAQDPANPAVDFIYHRFERIDNKVIKRRFVLNRDEAAKTNTPKPEDAEAAVKAGITLTTLSYPHRELEPGEIAEIDPFGKLIISKPTLDLTLESLHAKVDRVIALLEAKETQ